MKIIVRVGRREKISQIFSSVKWPPERNSKQNSDTQKITRMTRI